MYMHATKERVDDLFQLTSVNYAPYYHWLDLDFMGRYQALLESIAERSNYKEGDVIRKDDLDEINVFVSEAYDTLNQNMRARVAELPLMERAEFNAIKPMISVTDQMFVMALQTLGCPNIPVCFGDEMKEKFKSVTKSATMEIRRAAIASVEPDDYFNRQRKKDAWEIARDNAALFERLYDAANPRSTAEAAKIDVAVLVAEYKALKKRQEGHGGWWKFFHRGENKEREQMLAEMKRLITVFTDDDVDLERPIDEIVDLDDLVDDEWLDRAIKSEQEFWGMETRVDIEQKAFRYKSEKTSKKTEDSVKKDPSKVTVSQNVASQPNENGPREVEPVSPKIFPLMQSPSVKQELVDTIMSQLPENPDPKQTPEKARAKLTAVLNGPLLNTMIIPLCVEFDQAMSDRKNLTEAMERVVDRVQVFAKSSAALFNYTDGKLHEQAIAVLRDNVLKKLSPVAVAPEKLGDFANGYVERFPDKFDWQKQWKTIEKEQREAVVNADDDESEYVPDYSSSSSGDSESNVDEEIRESIRFMGGEFEEDQEIDLSSVVSDEPIVKDNPKIEK